MKNQLVFIANNNQVLTNSRLVATYFEKRHKDVLKKIDNLKCDPTFKTNNFVQVNLVAENSKREYRAFLITKEGFSLLALSYNSKKAAIFKQNFSKVANKLNEQTRVKRAQVESNFEIPKTKAEALQLAADQAKLLEEQKPLVEFAEKVLGSENSITIAEFAKSLNVGRNKMMEFLRKENYLMSAKSKLNQPYQKYMKNGTGYFEYTVHVINRDSKPVKIFQPLITSKGMLALQKAYNSKSVEKLIHV